MVPLTTISQTPPFYLRRVGPNFQCAGAPRATAQFFQVIPVRNARHVLFDDRVIIQHFRHDEKRKNGTLTTCAIQHLQGEMIRFGVRHLTTS
jgi:hypothetical protein